MARILQLQRLGNFKLYKSQIPVVEQAIERAALMLGTDTSRGYCLKMICSATRGCAEMAGDAKRVARCQTLRFTTKNSAAIREATPRKT